jgi:hypothetical protein
MLEMSRIDSNTWRTHPSHSQSARRALQHPHWLRRILARCPACSLSRMVDQAHRGAQDPVLFRRKPGKGASGKPRAATVRFLPIGAHRPRVGAPQRRAFGYRARSTRFECVGARRQASRGRERTEVAEGMALQWFPPSRAEASTGGIASREIGGSDVNAGDGDSWAGHLSSCGHARWVNADHRSCRGIYGLQVRFLDGPFWFSSTTVCSFLDNFLFYPASV